MFLPKALLFATLSVCTLAGLDQVIDFATESHSESQYEAMTKGHERFEHIVLGTSHGALGLDTHYLEGSGKRFYNFCAGSGGPGYFAKWYQIYRKHQPAPKTILYSVDWFMFKGIEAKRPIEADSEYLPILSLLELAFQPSTSLSVMARNRFPLVKEQTRLASRLFGDRPSIVVQMDKYHRGFVPLKKTPYNPNVWVFKASDQRASISAFETLLDTFARDGAQVVFVQTPEYLPQSGAHAENERLQRLARGRGIPFLNYNGDRRSALNTDIEAYIDWGHLNGEGAQRFGQRLQQDLRRLGIL